MNGSYWHNIVSSRVSRRRAIGGTAGLGLAAASLSLFGCGGSDSDSGGSSEPVDKSGLLHKPVDSTSSAKQGGVLKDFQTNEVLHFDSLLSNSSQTVNNGSVFAYSRLLKFKPGVYPTPADGASEGDLMESFEISPDKLTITFKMRQGVKWDSRSPTNGRVMDTDDILFSWKKFAALNPAAQSVVYDAVKSPGAPVESFTATDNRTMVMKLKAPDSSLIPILSGFDVFYIMPRESDGGFDPKTVVRGHGPWMLDEYVPSARVAWNRNPEYYLKGRPFPDRLERPIVVDYSQRLAQFKAGNIYPTVATQQDMVQTKKDVPALLMRQLETFPTTMMSYLGFGYEGNSPFKDQRMRQAVSLMMDRESIADVIESRDTFRKDGLEVPTAFNTLLGAGWPGDWLDPTNEKEFGPTAKYLKFDLAESKKLLAAAGHANGVEFDFIYNQDNTYGALYTQLRELYTGMFVDGGLKPSLKAFPYNQFLENYTFGYLSRQFISGEKKGYNGIALIQERPYNTAAATLFGTSHKDGVAFHGATPDGRNAHMGDPKLNDMIDKIRLETDRPKQRALIHDVLRYHAGQAYLVPRASYAKGFSLNWPVIGNEGLNSTYNGGSARAETNMNWWIDSTKAPLAKS